MPTYSLLSSDHITAFNICRRTNCCSYTKYPIGVYLVFSTRYTPIGYLSRGIFKTGHYLSRHSHIMCVIRRSISMRAVLHSPGYFFAALNARVTKSAEPTGSMVLSIPSGKTKCVPCSYMSASTSQDAKT